MGKLYGYGGKELWVDLTAETVCTKEIDPDRMRKYLGGTGYGTSLLFDELKAGAVPLSDDNVLIFATGPLTLNKVPGGGTVMLIFKSPLTGILGQSRCGGDFGTDLRRTGHDFIIFKGHAKRPLYLEVTESGAALRDAACLKGKDIYEKDKMMREQLQETPKARTSTMVIGLGGENMVKYASVMCGDRAAGRTGAGALMGYMNLLGVIVSGTLDVEAADPETLTAVIKETMREVTGSDACKGLNEYGTTGDIVANDEDGDLPTMNWRSNAFGKAAEMYDYFHEHNLVRPGACYRGCPVRCGRVVEVKEGRHKTRLHEGSEYETIAMFTAMIMNDDVEFAVKCGFLCNMYGLDTISTAAVIGYAMECFENNIITEKDTGGVALKWGDEEAILHCIDLIVNRKLVGDVLAEGVRRAGELLGQGADKFAMHIKGLEGPAHDPRSGKILGLTYATANRGFCHIQPFEGQAYDRGKMWWGMEKYGVRDPETMDRFDEKGKGLDCKLLQDGLTSPDVLSTCKFLMYAGVTLDHWAAMVAALTGWDFDGKELLLICERVNNLARLFNIREGISRKDDMLPKRLLSLPEFGAYENNQDCVISDFDALLDEYYMARGWDPETGYPTAEKLEELGLSEYAGVVTQRPQV